MFKDLNDATDRLFKSIPELKGDNWLLLSISDSGEKIGSKLSNFLHIPHQRIYIESIFCQKNPDCEIAMITELQNIRIDEVLKDTFQLDKELLVKAIKAIYELKLIPKIEKARGKREQIKIDEKIDKIILIDETIETGLRMETAISTVMDIIGVEEIYIATPVIPEQMFSLFESSVETIFYSEIVDMYTDIEDYYSERENR